MDKNLGKAKEDMLNSETIRVIKKTDLLVGLVFYLLTLLGFLASSATFCLSIIS